MTDRAQVMLADHAPRGLMHELTPRVRPMKIVTHRSEVGQGRGGVDRPVSSGLDLARRFVWITQAQALHQRTWSASPSTSLARFEIAA